MDGTSSILVCFAVREEATPFRTHQPPGIDILLTGIGPKNAERAVRRHIERGRPTLILTCGFAGGLDPALEIGSVVYEVDPLPDLDQQLIGAGAVRGRFHASERVAVTAAEKQRLREQTGADAVEMESGVIRNISRSLGIPSATI